MTRPDNDNDDDDDDNGPLPLTYRGRSHVADRCQCTASMACGDQGEGGEADSTGC